MDRRQFIKSTSQAAVGLVMGGSIDWLHAAPRDQKTISSHEYLDFTVPLSPSLPQIVIAQGDSPAAMVKRAIAAFGGIGRFISKGDLVVLKPNASWDRNQELGANTHPAIVGTLTELSLEAGARKVIALDNTLGEPRRCFAISGIGPAVTKAGGSIEFQDDRNFKEVDLHGNFVRTRGVFKQVLKADKFINMPVVKQHSLSKLTASMKNLFGVVSGWRAKLHWEIHQSIVDLAQFVRPTLVVLDAFRVMVKDGPSGGRPDDLIHPHKIAVGTDPVALDAYAASFLGLKPEEIGYIRLAHEKKLGDIDYKKMRVKQIT